MLKPNTSPKSPWIELSNDTFAERKYCQVSAYESETFHRRRSYGISHCENGKQKPPKRPLPVGLRWPPSNTAVPRPTASTTRNRSSAATNFFLIWFLQLFLSKKLEIWFLILIHSTCRPISDTDTDTLPKMYHDTWYSILSCIKIRIMIHVSLILPNTVKRLVLLFSVRVTNERI